MKPSGSVPGFGMGIPILVWDYLRSEKRASSLFPRYPKNLDDLIKRKPAELLSTEERKRLAEIFLEYMKDFDAPEASLRNAEKMAQPGCFAIITGQQPGFLLGPTYTLLKVATAVRLAGDLEKKGFPAIPVFWNHSEDHDLEETNHAFFANENLDLQKFRLPYSNEKKYLSEVALNGEAGKVFDAACTTLPDTEYSEEMKELFRPREGRTLSQEVTRILLDLFGDNGLVVIEPGPLRELSHKALVEALRLPGGIYPALEEGRKKLEAEGYPVPIPEDQALLFDYQSGRRERLDRNAVEQPGLAEEIEKNPARFSPGVLLRPAGQFRAIPQLAYIGGPAEIAYSAQFSVLLEKLGYQNYNLLLRFSATFIEPALKKMTHKYEITPEDAFGGEEELEKKILGDLPIPDERIKAIAEKISADFKNLEEDLLKIDGSLAGPLKRTETSITTNLEKFRGKVVNAARNKSGTGKRQVKKLTINLFPHGKPQERTLNPLTFLVRHGRGFVRDLVNTIDPFTHDHWIIDL